MSLLKTDEKIRLSILLYEHRQFMSDHPSLIVPVAVPDISDILIIICIGLTCDVLFELIPGQNIKNEQTTVPKSIACSCKYRTYVILRQQIIDAVAQTDDGIRIPPDIPFSHILLNPADRPARCLYG